MTSCKRSHVIIGWFPSSTVIVWMTMLVSSHDSTVTSSSNVTLSVPGTYEIFSGDLLITIYESNSEDVGDVDTSGDGAATWSVEIVCINHRLVAESSVDGDNDTGHSSRMIATASVKRFQHDSVIGLPSHSTLTYAAAAVIPCGTINTGASCVARLMERMSDGTSRVLSTSSSFDAVDNSARHTTTVELRLPLTHRLLTEIPLTLILNHRGTNAASPAFPSACNRQSADKTNDEKDIDDNDDRTYSLELVYFRSNTTGSSTVGTVEVRETVEVIKLADLVSANSIDLSMTGQTSLRVAFLCSSADRPGEYQAELWSSMSLRTRGSPPPVSSSSAVVVVAVSNRMLVAPDTSNALYSLSVLGFSSSSTVPFTKLSVFPCKGRHFIVRYTQPACAGRDDRIRVYERLPASSERREPENAIEKSSSPRPVITTGNSRIWTSTKVRPDTQTLTFISDKKVHQQHAMVTFDCDLFRQTALEYCFLYVSKSTGDAPMKERARVCLPTYLSPSASDKNGTISTRLKKSNGTVPSSTSTLCRCGCVSSRDEGRIVGLTAADMRRHCTSELAAWSIISLPGHVIRLTFERVRLVRGSSISVFDGDASSEDGSVGDLLKWYRGADEEENAVGFDSTGSGPSPEADMDREVRSTGNAMRIEYRIPKYSDIAPHQRLYGDEEPDAFKAFFISVEANSSSDGVPVAGSDVISTGSYLPDNTVTMVGIGVCCAIVVASVSFVFRQNLIVRRLRAKQALLTPAAYRAMHDAVPNSPSGHRRQHRKNCNPSRGGEASASKLSKRELLNDTPPPLPVPLPLYSDQSVVADGYNDDASDVERRALEAIDRRFQSAVDRNPTIGDRYRTSSLLMLHRSEQLSLPPQVVPLTPLTDKHHQRTHRQRRPMHRQTKQHHNQQQELEIRKSGMQPVSPAVSRWSTGHGGGHLSVWKQQRGSSGASFLPFRSSAANCGRLTMVNDQLTVDSRTSTGRRSDEDPRAVAAAAVAALGRFYSVPKSHQNQMWGRPEYLRRQSNESPPTASLLKSATRFHSGTDDNSFRCSTYSGNFITMTAADYDFEMFPVESFSPLEKRPPVEGRDSMTADNVADLALPAQTGNKSPTMSMLSSATLTDGGASNIKPCCSADCGNSPKTARYIAPAAYPVAERRKLIQNQTASDFVEHRDRKQKPITSSSRRGVQHRARGGGAADCWLSPKRSPVGIVKRSSSLSSLSDIVGAADDSDMLEFDDDEYNDYYRAVDAAVSVGRLKPSVSFDKNRFRSGRSLLFSVEDARTAIGSGVDEVSTSSPLSVL